MKYKQFVSNEGWINLNYPSNMTCIEEVEGTYLFYTEETGSFRITPFKLKGNKIFNPDKYLNDQLTENGGEMLQNLYNKYIFYISHSEDDENILTIYNWFFATQDKVVYCSYSVDANRINYPEIISEKEEIFKIIKNLKIN